MMYLKDVLNTCLKLNFFYRSYQKIAILSDFYTSCSHRQWKLSSKCNCETEVLHSSYMIVSYEDKYYKALALLILSLLMKINVPVGHV